MIALIAFIAFGEIPDIFTIIGVTVIIGATLYSARQQTPPDG